MPTIPWIERLLAGTRGQIIRLLRRSPRTVSELATELELTDNAVRAHLAALERDGLVEQLPAVRRGVGKPAFVYRLTSAADGLQPKAYAPVLGGMVALLMERLGPEEAEGVLREVGRRVGEAHGAEPGGSVRERAAVAVRALAELGGVAEVEAGEGVVVLRGYSCPLAAVVPEHPQVCRLAESLVEAVVGAPVRERCAKGERPRCCFEIDAGGGASP